MGDLHRLVIIVHLPRRGRVGHFLPEIQPRARRLVIPTGQRRRAVDLDGGTAMGTLPGHIKRLRPLDAAILIERIGPKGPARPRYILEVVCRPQSGPEHVGAPLLQGFPVPDFVTGAHSLTGNFLLFSRICAAT